MGIQPTHYTIWDCPDPHSELKFLDWEEKWLIVATDTAKQIWPRYSQWTNKGPLYRVLCSDDDGNMKTESPMLTQALREKVFKNTPKHDPQILRWIVNKFTGKSRKFQHILAPYACSTRLVLFEEYRWASEPVDLTLTPSEWPQSTHRATSRAEEQAQNNQSESPLFMPQACFDWNTRLKSGGDASDGTILHDTIYGDNDDVYTLHHPEIESDIDYEDFAGTATSRFFRTPALGPDKQSFGSAAAASSPPNNESLCKGKRPLHEISTAGIRYSSPPVKAEESTFTITEEEFGMSGIPLAIPVTRYATPSVPQSAHSAGQLALSYHLQRGKTDPSFLEQGPEMRHLGMHNDNLPESNLPGSQFGYGFASEVPAATPSDLGKEKAWWGELAAHVLKEGMSRRSQDDKTESDHQNLHVQLGEKMVAHAVDMSPVPSNALCHLKMSLTSLQRSHNISSKAAWWRRVAGLVIDGAVALRLQTGPQRQGNAEFYFHLAERIYTYASYVLVESQKKRQRSQRVGGLAHSLACSEPDISPANDPSIPSLAHPHMEQQTVSPPEERRPSKRMSSTSPLKHRRRVEHYIDLTEHHVDDKTSKARSQSSRQRNSRRHASEQTQEAPSQLRKTPALDEAQTDLPREGSTDSSDMSIAESSSTATFHDDGLPTTSIHKPHGSASPRARLQSRSRAQQDADAPRTLREGSLHQSGSQLHDSGTTGSPHDRSAKERPRNRQWDGKRIDNNKSKKRWSKAEKKTAKKRRMEPNESS